MTTILEQLVRINSVNPAFGGPRNGEARVAEYIGHFCSARGLEVTYHEVLPGRPNVVATRLIDKGRPRLVFEGHLDTVGVGAMANPFDPLVRDGRLHGRGACDAKGGIAAALHAFERLVEMEDLGIDLEFVGAMDEEVGFRGVLGYLSAGGRGGAAVVIEPTSLVPVIAHAGVLRGRLRSIGTAAHSSRPELGDNAIDKLTHSLITISDWAADRKPNRHDLTGSSSFSITTITGGEAINVIPRQCEAQFDWRLHPTDDPKQACGDLQAFLQETCPAVEIGEVSLEDRGLETQPGAAIVRAAQDACRVTTGSTALIGVPWGSDASKFSRHGSWEAIVLGPGSAEQAHTDNEWIDIEELATSSDLYVEVATKFALRT